MKEDNCCGSCKKGKECDSKEATISAKEIRDKKDAMANGKIIKK